MFGFGFCVCYDDTVVYKGCEGKSKCFSEYITHVNAFALS